jgi:hypothetical protein
VVFACASNFGKKISSAQHLLQPNFCGNICAWFEQIVDTKGIAWLAKSAQVQTHAELDTKWGGLYTGKGAWMYICGTG